MPKRPPDIRALAKRQKLIIWLVLASVLLQGVWLSPLAFSPMMTSPGLAVVFMVVQIVLTVLLVVGVVLTEVALRSNPVIIVFVALLMLAPCISILILLIVNQHATSALRKAGLKVGFMGARLADVERILDPRLCRFCAYELTGNISGSCPECGHPIYCRQCGHALPPGELGACPTCQQPLAHQVLAAAMPVGEGTSQQASGIHEGRAGPAS